MMLMIGNALGFWVLYALLALLFKHERGIVVAIIIGLLGGIISFSAENMESSNTLLWGVIIGAPMIYLIVPMQVNSKKKNEWRDEITGEIKREVLEENKQVKKVDTKNMVKASDISSEITNKFKNIQHQKHEKNLLLKQLYEEGLITQVIYEQKINEYNEKHRENIMKELEEILDDEENDTNEINKKQEVTLSVVEKEVKTEKPFCLTCEFFINYSKDENLKKCSGCPSWDQLKKIYAK